MDTAEHLNLSDLRDQASASLPSVLGAALPALDIALIQLGVAAAVSSLDRHAIDRTIDAAFGVGATSQQVQEVVSLVSGLGVHSLMVTAQAIVAAAARAGEELDARLTESQQSLWTRHVGDDPFWVGFERELPGFLDALLRLSPEQFVAFFDYCAVPWKTGTVPAATKELIAMASDATPTHRFLPGFKIHLANAIKLGVGRAAIMQTLDIAAAAPPHIGTR